MITNKYRPTTFKEVAGQELNIKIMKAIIENPEKAAHSIIMQGPYGNGKTTFARILARALNCEDKANFNPCLKCGVCTIPYDESPFYIEYDAAVVGSVDKIRELRDTFYYHIGGYKVICLDEIHTASKMAMSALLKVIEEAPNRVFFVFCTTDIEKMLPTIRSRSLEMRFEIVSDKDVENNLLQIAGLEEKEVSDKALKLIVSKAKGHMRNAHMYLDQYFQIGKENFEMAMESSRLIFIDYFYNLAKKDNQGVFGSIDNLMKFPLADLKEDFQRMILEFAQVMVGQKEDLEIKKIVDILGLNTMKVIKYALSDWVLNSFNSDSAFRTCFLCVYQMFRDISFEPVNLDSLQKRAIKR